MFLSRCLSAQSQPSFLPQAISFLSLWSFAVWGRPGRSSDVRWKERGWFPTIIIPVLHRPIPSILKHKWYWSAALWMLSPPALGWAFQERVFEILHRTLPTLCLPDVTTHDQIYQAFPSIFANTARLEVGTARNKAWVYLWQSQCKWIGGWKSTLYQGMHVQCVLHTTKHGGCPHKVWWICHRLICTTATLHT